MDLSDVPQTTRTTLMMRNRMERDHAMPSPITEGDMDAHTTLTGSQLARLSMSGDDMEMDNDFPASTPTTPKKGRARSGAFTEKRKYVVGYREDCEKCRNHVPGHYSHFLSQD